LRLIADAHVDFLAVLLARGGRERGFERLEDDFLVDAFSLETASTTIRISLFISRPPATRGSKRPRQVRLANATDRQRPALAVHLDLDRLRA